MRKIIIISLILLLLSPLLFSQEIKDFTASFYISLDEESQLSWCIGFLQGMTQVVSLLQKEYNDYSYLDFWKGSYMPIDLFKNRLDYFIRNSNEAGRAPLPYLGLIVLQHYYENDLRR